MLKIVVCSGNTQLLCLGFFLQMRPQKEKVQMTQKQHKELKDLRKQIAMSKVSNITKVTV